MSVSKKKWVLFWTILSLNIIQVRNHFWKNFENKKIWREFCLFRRNFKVWIFSRIFLSMVPRMCSRLRFAAADAFSAQAHRAEQETFWNGFSDRVMNFYSLSSDLNFLLWKMAEMQRFSILEHFFGGFVLSCR